MAFSMGLVPTGSGLAAAFARERFQIQQRLGARATHQQVTRALDDSLELVFQTVRDAQDHPDDATAEAVEAQLRELHTLIYAAVLGSMYTVLVEEQAPAPPPPPQAPQRPTDDRGWPAEREWNPWVRFPEDQVRSTVEGVRRFADRVTRPASPPATVPGPAPVSQVVDVNRLLHSLAGVFEAADRLLDAAKPPPPQRELLPWAKDSQLIDLFHDLLEAQAERDGELALNHIVGLKGQLVQQGIRIVVYSGENDELFGFARNLDPTDTSFTTVRPALLAGGDVLRRGLVRGPATAVTPAPDGPPALEPALEAGLERDEEGPGDA
jgi:hypothetical protein